MTEEVKSRSGGPRVESREPNRIEFDSGEPSRKDSKRSLRAYIPIIVNRNIVGRISIRLIYEISSTDGTCVKPLVKACIKLLIEHSVCIKCFI